MIPRIICALFGHLLWIRTYPKEVRELGPDYYVKTWNERCPRCGKSLVTKKEK